MREKLGRAASYMRNRGLGLAFRTWRENVAVILDERGKLELAFNLMTKTAARKVLTTWVQVTAMLIRQKERVAALVYRAARQVGLFQRVAELH